MTPQSPVVATAARDARWHLRSELAWITKQLGRLLGRQRQRGRAADADLVHEVLIEPGEAEGLVQQLAAAWSPIPGSGHAAPAAADTVRSEIDRLADAAASRGVFLPLRHAARTFETTLEEYQLLLLALAVEIDPRFGRLVAYLNDHVGRTAGTLGLAFGLSGADDEPVTVPVGIASRPVFRDGLLVLDSDGPLPGRAFHVHPSMLARLTSEADPESATAKERFQPPRKGALGQLVLAEEFRRSLTTMIASVRTTPGSPSWTLILEGTPGSGRTVIARAVASELAIPLVSGEVRQPTLEDDLCAIRRECRWRTAAALVQVADDVRSDSDWRALWAGLPGKNHSLTFVEAAPTATAVASETHPNYPIVIGIPELGRPERAALWERFLPEGHTLGPEDFERLASRFALSPKRMLQAVGKVRAELLLRPPGERRVDFQALSEAVRTMGVRAMGGLSQRLPLMFGREDLVIPPELGEELALAMAWVRHESRVLDKWGLGRRVPYGRGLALLFTGPPGTGKTMAAQVLARELGLDLYRVDLSQLVSKYIGETEKNLGRLFDEAHASGAVLFFDEADAIFGKRTEVKDAHDRYANVEIGYLLQRMEEHDGVTLLATNRKQDMDEAFVRRFHSILNFPMPDAANRLRIWEGMLPAELEREPNLDLAPLANRFEISGGEIRNAVVAACYMAAADGRPLGMPHLRRALRREIRKAGRFAADPDLKFLEG